MPPRVRTPNTPSALEAIGGLHAERSDLPPLPEAAATQEVDEVFEINLSRRRRMSSNRPKSSAPSPMRRQSSLRRCAARTRRSPAKARK